MRTKSTSSNGSAAASAAAQNFRVSSPKDGISHGYLKEHYASISKKAQQKRSQDRVSPMASATLPDADPL